MSELLGAVSTLFRPVADAVGLGGSSGFGLPDEESGTLEGPGSVSAPLTASAPGRMPMGRQDNTLEPRSQDILSWIFGGPVSGAEIEYDTEIPPEVIARSQSFLGIRTNYNGENVAYVNAPGAEARLGRLGASPREAVESVAVQEVAQKVIEDRFGDRMSARDQETLGALPSLYSLPGPTALNYVDIAATAIAGGYSREFTDQYSGVVANALQSLESTLVQAGVVQRGDVDGTKAFAARMLGIMRNNPNPVPAIEAMIRQQGGDPTDFVDQLAVNMTAQFEAAAKPILASVGVAFQPRTPIAP